MIYFKILINDKLIGVATEYNLRRYQQKYNVLYLCDLNQAQFIELNGKLYRDKWFAAIFEHINVDYIFASVEQIDLEEYLSLTLH